MRRLFKWLVLLLIVVGGLAAAVLQGRQYLKAGAAPKFTTATVSVGKVEAVVNSTGPVRPVQSVSVGSFVSGPILEIYVDFNTVVEKDELIALIDPRLPQAAFDREMAALATQKAELTRIQAQLDQAVANESRALRLQKTNPDYLSEQEMDQLKFSRIALQAQKTVAEANIKVAQAGVDNAQANLEYTKILSPVAGIVIDKKVERGQTVASAFQTPELFVIAPDLDKHVYVYASVDEADIGQIRTAQEQDRPVKFTVDAYPEDVFGGTIYQVRKLGTTTQNVVTYPVIIEAPNPDLKLLPGMTASVSFQIDVRDKVTRIPSAALRYVPPDHLIRPEDRHHVELKARKDPKEGEERLSAERRAEQARARSQRVVWVPDGPQVRAVPITIGLVDGQYAELVAGEVAPGQELVTGIEGESPRARR